MKSTARQILATATVTSILSLFIGGFAVWGSYQSELSIVDGHLNTIVLDVAQSPANPIAAALLSIEENNFDITLAFMAPTGEVVPLKESGRVSLEDPQKLRIQYIQLSGGEKLLVAASILQIDRNLARNLWRLLVFIIFANSLASFVSILINRSSALALERGARKKMQEFLGDAAHELRTPLTVIKGYSQLLEGNQLEPERAALAFERLNSEIKRMESLVADLLILAELGEENVLPFSMVNLSELLTDNVRDYALIAPEISMELAIDDQISINGSEKYLQRFIANALTNIRVHTEANVLVRITLKGGREITLIIEDGGAGLPEQYYGEKIQGLKRFDRSRSRENGGSGLGLSIMSAVIERHNGTLTLRKSDLGGLAVEVHFRQERSAR